MASLRVLKRWKPKEAWSGLTGGWGRRVRVSRLLPMFSNLCVWPYCVMPKKDISNIFVSQTLLKCFSKVLRVWMYRPELKVSPQGIMSSLINPSASQNIVAMTFTAEQVALNFLLQEAGRRHSKTVFFLQFKVMDPCFILSDDPQQKLSPASQWERTSENTPFCTDVR